MAVTIRNFSHQNMIINMDFRLNVRILGGATDVQVDGLPDNLYYHWNADRERVQIRGRPEKLVINAEMVVRADDQVKRQTYSVLPVVPVFDEEVVETLIRGIPFTLSVPVQNAYNSVDITGPLINLRSKWDAYGYHLYGTVPEDAEFTRDTFEFQVRIGNLGGSRDGIVRLVPQMLSDTNFYILDGDGSTANTKIKVYPVVEPPAAGSTSTVAKVKEFSLPNIPGTTANYVAVANDGTNLYLLHSKPQSLVTTKPADLDDQIVVVSPETADGGTAGILRRFTITRTSNYYDHELEDLYYSNGKLYILTSYVTPTAYNSYSVLYTIDGSDITRIISLLARGGGIALTRGYLTTLLFSRNSPNQGNLFRIHPPSYVTGMPLIADSAQVYSTPDIIEPDFGIMEKDISMTSVNDFAYVLSSTLRSALNVVEVPDPVGTPIKRGQVILSPALTAPQGITHV